MKNRRHRKKRCRVRLILLILLLLAILVLWPKRVHLDGLISPNAILLEADSGEVLAEKNADSQIYPASMTKMMTALLAIEAEPDLDRQVTIPEDVFPALEQEGASMAGFKLGEVVAIRDLLYGALLPSGAECCETLARLVSGTEADFVALMNQKAAELGMTSTHFCNPTGLHDPEHVSTVRDISTLLREAVRNETFRKILTTERYTIQPTNLHPKGFTVTNTLLRELNGDEIRNGKILGGKTGYTSEAGLCLASIAEVKEKEYLLVTAGALGNHETEQYHIEDAVKAYRQLARGSLCAESLIFAAKYGISL